MSGNEDEMPERSRPGLEDQTRTREVQRQRTQDRPTREVTQPERGERVREQIAQEAGEDYTPEDVELRPGQAGSVRGQLSEEAIRREAADDILEDTDRFSREDIDYERIEEGGIQAGISEGARRREAAEQLSEETDRDIQPEDIEVTETGAELSDEAREREALQDLQDTTAIELTGEDLVLEDGSVQLSEQAQQAEEQARRDDAISDVAQDSDRFDTDDFEIVEEDGEQVVAPTEEALERERQELRDEVLPELQEETEAEITREDIQVTESGVQLSAEIRQQEAFPQLQEETRTELEPEDIRVTDDGVTITEQAQREEAVEELQSDTPIRLSVQNIEIEDGQAQLTERTQEEIAVEDLEYEVRNQISKDVSGEIGYGPGGLDFSTGDIEITDEGVTLTESGQEKAQEAAQRTQERAFEDDATPLSEDLQEAQEEAQRAAAAEQIEQDIRDEGLDIQGVSPSDIEREGDSYVIGEAVREQIGVAQAEQLEGVELGEGEEELVLTDEAVAERIETQLASESGVGGVGDALPAVSGNQFGPVDVTAEDITPSGELTDEVRREIAAERFSGQIETDLDVDPSAVELTDEGARLRENFQRALGVEQELDQRQREFERRQDRAETLARLEDTQGVDVGTEVGTGRRAQLEIEAQADLADRLEAQQEAYNREAIRQISAARPAGSVRSEEQIRADVAEELSQEADREISAGEVELVQEDGQRVARVEGQEGDSGDGGGMFGNIEQTQLGRDVIGGLEDASEGIQENIIRPASEGAGFVAAVSQDPEQVAARGGLAFATEDDTIEATQETITGEEFGETDSERIIEQGTRGAGITVDAPGATLGLIRAGDYIGAGGEAFVEGREDEFIDASIEAAEERTSQFVQSAQERPFETGAFLGGSLLATAGGTAAVSRVSPTAGRAAPFAFQPGEEVLTRGLTATAGQTARGQRALDAIGGQLDPENIAITAGSRAREAIAPRLRAGTRTPEERNLGVVDSIRDIRERTPDVSVERQPTGGLVEVDPLARRQIREGTIGRFEGRGDLLDIDPEDITQPIQAGAQQAVQRTRELPSDISQAGRTVGAGVSGAAARTASGVRSAPSRAVEGALERGENVVRQAPTTSAETGDIAIQRAVTGQEAFPGGVIGAQELRQTARRGRQIASEIQSAVEDPQRLAVQGLDRVRTAGATELDPEDVYRSDLLRESGDQIVAEELPGVTRPDLYQESPADALRAQAEEFTPTEVEQLFEARGVTEGSVLTRALGTEPEGPGIGRGGLTTREGDYEVPGASFSPELSPSYLRTGGELGLRPTAVMARTRIADVEASGAETDINQLQEFEQEIMAREGEAEAVPSQMPISEAQAEAVVPPGVDLQRVESGGPARRLARRAGIGSEFYVEVGGRRVPVDPVAPTGELDQPTISEQIESGIQERFDAIATPFAEAGADVALRSPGVEGDVALQQAFIRGSDVPFPDRPSLPNIDIDTEALARAPREFQTGFAFGSGRADVETTITPDRQVDTTLPSSAFATGARLGRAESEITDTVSDLGTTIREAPAATAERIGALRDVSIRVRPARPRNLPDEAIRFETEPGQELDFPTELGEEFEFEDAFEAETETETETETDERTTETRPGEPPAGETGVVVERVVRPEMETETETEPLSVNFRAELEQPTATEPLSESVDVTREVRDVESPGEVASELESEQRPSERLDGRGRLGTDLGQDIEQRLGPELETEFEGELERELERELELEQELETETEQRIEPEGRTEIEQRTEPRSELETLTELETETEVESELESEVEAETELEVEPFTFDPDDPDDDPFDEDFGEADRQFGTGIADVEDLTREEFNSIDDSDFEL